MRSIFIPAVAALGFLTFPAFAHSSGGTSAGSTGNTAQDVPQIVQTLHQSLSKAGYTDIHIMPGSFLVHAKDSKGQMTEMMINPHSVTEITDVSQSSGSTQSGSGASGSAPKK